VSASAPADAAGPEAVEALLRPWDGPYGGLPPFDRVTPAALEQAYRMALQRMQTALAEIASGRSPPGSADTLEALEDCGRAFKRVEALVRACLSTANQGAMQAALSRLAPSTTAIDDALLQEPRLYARIEALREAPYVGALSPAQRRLVEVLHGRLRRAGAALPAPERSRLQSINARTAELAMRFRENLLAEDARAVFMGAEADLEGLDATHRARLAAAAEARGRAGVWAVADERSAVHAFLTHSTRRDLREEVWRMWQDRGDRPGDGDNKPVIAEMLRLRGEKARLLGYPSYAHLALADRMVDDPMAVLQMLQRTWSSVAAATRRRSAELQAIAEAEGQRFRLEPWDHLHYAGKLRRARFGFDAEALRQHLPLDQVLEAMFDAAGGLHGLGFERLHGVPVLHPDVRVYAVTRGEPVGLLYLDLLARPGKVQGSHQQVYRAAERFRGRALPVAAINSGIAPPPPGGPALLPWEYANVLFHEFGHALHTLLDEAEYPSLGSTKVAWDLIELPALLNERWLQQRPLLRRHARHHATQQPVPERLLDALEATLRADRIFSLDVGYLATAIIDLRLHLSADGRDIDAVAAERDILREIGMPHDCAPIMRVTCNAHAFEGAYAAGLYVYLWADIMAADVAAAFEAAPGGLYDAGVAEAWRRCILTVGHGVPARDAFRAFRGRDPDEGPLLRRYGLEAYTPAVPA